MSMLRSTRADLKGQWGGVLGRLARNEYGALPVLKASGTSRNTALRIISLLRSAN